MDDKSTALTHGEELRKSGKFGEALALFEQAWNASKSPGAGWRIAFCLRKLGKPQQALDFIDRVLEVFPNDEWVRREAVWSINAAVVQPAQRDADVARAIAGAARMLDLAQDALGRELAVFGVTKTARARKYWTTILEWTEKIDPQQLSTRPRENERGQYMSPREQWYHARVRALHQTGRHREARELSEQALRDFPHQRDFVRWGALSLAELGDLEAAIQELERASSRDGAWYLLDSLSELLLSAGRPEEAWQAGARAMLGPGEAKAKVRGIARLAQISSDLGDEEAAAVQAHLAIALRENEEWPVSDRLLALARGGDPALGSATVPELMRRARALWRGQTEGKLPVTSGTVAALPAGKPFGFLKDDQGHEYFVFVEDVPPVCRKVGAKVVFKLVKNFDQKKQRESLRAVDVHEAAKEKPPKDDDFRLDL